MNLWSRRETPTQNIAFLALMAGATAALSLLISFVPFSALIAVIFLPLFSALAALLCRDRYLIPYVIAACAVSLLASLYDISMAIFYVMPSVIAGTFYGFLAKKRIPDGVLVLAVALLELGLNYLAILFLKGITGVDFIASVLTLLGLSEKASAITIMPTFLFVYALAETTLAHLVVVFAFQKLDIKSVEIPVLKPLLPALGILMVGGTIIGAFFLPSLGCFLFVLALYFSVFSAPYLYKAKWYYFVAGGVLALVGFFLAAFLYSYLPSGAGILIYSLILLGILFPTLWLSVLFSYNGKEEK